MKRALILNNDVASSAVPLQEFEDMRDVLERLANLQTAQTADEALLLLRESKFDLIVVSSEAGWLPLPGRNRSLLDQFKLQPQILRGAVLFVLGPKSPQALVRALECGADDYIETPLNPEELRARTLARFRRAVGRESLEDSFRKSSLKFLVGRQRVLYEVQGVERDLNLTPNEFKILYLLARNEGRALSRSNILREVWGEDLHIVERTVDKHICSLRRKLGPESHLVGSIAGFGYRFDSHPGAVSEGVVNNS